MSLTTIRLYGQMGAMFGREHRVKLESKTPAEAVSALMARIPGIRRYLINAKDNGVTFAVFAGKRNLSKEELRRGIRSDEEIRFAPILRGKKQGVFQTILGAILIVVGVFTSEFGGEVLVELGIGLMAGGIAQMLAPTPKTTTSADKNQANQANTSFNGSVNTQAQGNPIPVFYGGPMPVGSMVVSAGITVNEQEFTPTTAGRSNGFMGGGYGYFNATIRSS